MIDEAHRAARRPTPTTRPRELRELPDVIRGYEEIKLRNVVLSASAQTRS